MNNHITFDMNRKKIYKPDCLNEHEQVYSKPQRCYQDTLQPLTQAFDTAVNTFFRYNRHIDLSIVKYTIAISTVVGATKLPNFFGPINILILDIDILIIKCYLKLSLYYTNQS